jgi:hypothetical protein
VYDAADGVYWTPVPQLAQGQSYYIQNPGSNLTNTFVGTVVLSSTNTIPGNSALTFVSTTLPIGGDILSTNFNLPFIGGETVMIWNGKGYYAYDYAGKGVGTTLGYPSDWYDANGGSGTAAAITNTVYDAADGVYWTQPLTVGVGQGFLVQNPGVALSWTQNLSF